RRGRCPTGRRMCQGRRTRTGWGGQNGSGQEDHSKAVLSSRIHDIPRTPRFFKRRKREGHGIPVISPSELDGCADRPKGLLIDASEGFPPEPLRPCPFLAVAGHVPTAEETLVLGSRADLHGALVLAIDRNRVLLRLVPRTKEGALSRVALETPRRLVPLNRRRQASPFNPFRGKAVSVQEGDPQGRVILVGRLAVARVVPAFELQSLPAPGGERAEQADGNLVLHDVEGFGILVGQLLRDEQELDELSSRSPVADALVIGFLAPVVVCLVVELHTMGRQRQHGQPETLLVNLAVTGGLHLNDVIPPGLPLSANGHTHKSGPSRDRGVFNRDALAHPLEGER